MCDCGLCVLQVRGVVHHLMMTLPNHHFLEPKEMPTMTTHQAS